MARQHFLEAQAYLQRQLDLFIFVSTLFGLYDFAFYYFSFQVAQEGVWSVLLIRYGALLPLLTLFRFGINRIPQRASYIDRAGLVIIGVPSVRR